MLGYIRYGDGPKRPETGLLRLPAGTMAVLTLREERRPMALTARAASTRALISAEVSAWGRWESSPNSRGGTST